MKNHSTKSATYIALLIIFFAYGVLVGKYKLPPYNFLQSTINFISIAYKNGVNLYTTFESCEIEVISYIPSGSIAFVGHAYGSPRFSDPERFISPKLEKFIKDNKHLLKTIIFTGDVFKFPSLEKWRKLSSLTNGINVEIAPGNHDFIRPDSKDIFKISEFGKKNYPYGISSSSQEIILDDSVSSNWVVSKDTFNRLIKTNSRQVIIARHNIPILELVSFSNSKAGLSRNLDTFKSLSNKSGSSQYIWIIGDSGAFSNLPRLKCLQKYNHTFILNGIGDLDGDTIILEFDGKIYSYLL